jgi:hypothetical protein
MRLASSLVSGKPAKARPRNALTAKGRKDLNTRWKVMLYGATFIART